MHRPMQTYYCQIVTYPDGKLSYSSGTELKAANLNQAYLGYKDILRKRGVSGVQRIYTINVEKGWDNQLKITNI